VILFPKAKTTISRHSDRKQKLKQKFPRIPNQIVIFSSGYKSFSTKNKTLKPYHNISQYGSQQP
jgi:hypothetical protein